MKTTLAALALLSLLTPHSLALDSHVEAVTRIVEGAKGKVEKTADGQSLKLVDLNVPGAGPHDHRAVDPYDAAFFEHLSHITTLESLNIISTKANDEWIAPLGKLTNLKSLSFTNNGKLTDAGMATFAGLKNLEKFNFVGTAMTGAAYAKFEGFTKLVRVSHRGSSINDEGLKQLCAHLPNLESISLAHARFTDAGAPALATLTKLKGLEVGAHGATPAALKNITALPLEYLQLGEGFESSAALDIIKDIKTLNRLTLTNSKALTDADLQKVATMTQLQSLEFSGLVMTEERIPQLQAFAFLKSLRLVTTPKALSPELQAKVKALLPKTALRFE
jgi:hypothetical protein